MAEFGKKQISTLSHPPISSYCKTCVVMKNGNDKRYHTIADTVIAVLDFVKNVQTTKPNVIKLNEYPMNRMNNNRKFDFGKMAVVAPKHGV